MRDITRSHCLACGKPHPATLQEEDGSVIATVSCPSQERRVTLSEDAELFSRLRKRHPGLVAKDTPDRFWATHIVITERCDCVCPICYMDSGPTPAAPFLPVETVLARAAAVREAGGRTVVLIGGEPALHPALREIILGLRELGLKSILATNGLRLVEEAGLLGSLVDAGLGQVSVQFDTLNESTLWQMRGHRKLQEKLDLIRACLDRSIELGLVCTACDLNLGDLAGLVRWTMALPRLPKYLALQAMSRTGRHTDSAMISRETVIKRLCRDLQGISTENFWPLPPLPGLGIHVHPDCCSNLYLVRQGEQTVPLDHYVDMQKLINRMGKTSTQSWRRQMIGAACASFNWWRMLSDMLNPLTLRKRCLVVGIGDFHQPGFLNTSCLDHCATGVATDAGIIPACRYYLERSEQ